MRISTRLLTVATGAILVVAGGCTSDESGETGESVGSAVAAGTPEAVEESTSTPEPSPEPFQVASPVVEGPITEPNSPQIPQPAAPEPEGYVLEEYFISGETTDFELVGAASSDGVWSAQPADSADYRTRILVRRPPPERFSGVVIVEWLNVTAVESGPDWGYLSEVIGSSGHAYVAASVQAQGVEGGGTVLEVEVDQEAAEAAGAPDDEVDTSGLVNVDPERYGSLQHPGDNFAYDIYSQVGQALIENSDLLLGADPETIVAIGESQSASFLSTYANAVHPLADVYDAFMIHSRGASVAPIDGGYDRQVEDADSSFITDGVTIRTDLNSPVFIFESETDLTMLGYANARQEDTEAMRTWEVAGTAHSDAHVFRIFLGGPRDPGIASVIGCNDPINVGPHHETLQAAMANLIVWAEAGDVPPAGPRLEVTTTDGALPEIVRDELGMALGGVRTPLVDVPAFVPTGEPPTPVTLDSSTDGFDVCNLFGSTLGLTPEELAGLHGSAEEYLVDFESAAAAAVAEGFLLPADAEQLMDEARNDFVLLFE